MHHDSHLTVMVHNFLTFLDVIDQLCYILYLLYITDQSQHAFIKTLIL